MRMESPKQTHMNDVQVIILLDSISCKQIEKLN